MYFLVSGGFVPVTYLYDDLRENQQVLVRFCLFVCFLELSKVVRIKESQYGNCVGGNGVKFTVPTMQDFCGGHLSIQHDRARTQFKMAIGMEQDSFIHDTHSAKNYIKTMIQKQMFIKTGKSFRQVFYYARDFFFGGIIEYNAVHSSNLSLHKTSARVFVLVRVVRFYRSKPTLLAASKKELLVRKLKIYVESAFYSVFICRPFRVVWSGFLGR